MTLAEAIDRMKSMTLIAATATSGTHRAYAFSPGDAQALAMALGEMKRPDTGVAVTLLTACEAAERYLAGPRYGLTGDQVLTLLRQAIAVARKE